MASNSGAMVTNAFDPAAKVTVSVTWPTRTGGWSGAVLRRAVSSIATPSVSGSIALNGVPSPSSSWRSRVASGTPVLIALTCSARNITAPSFV